MPSRYAAAAIVVYLTVAGGTGLRLQAVAVHDRQLSQSLMLIGETYQLYV
jgi:hypothetical protein